MDEMINALTKGVGVILGQFVRREYFTVKDLVTRRQSWKNASETQQQLVIDMLALSVFQRLAMTPIHGSNSFLQTVKKEGVESVQMGSYKLGPEFQRQAGSISRTFFAITRKYGVEIRDLAITDIDGFIDTWILKERDGKR